MLVQPSALDGGDCTLYGGTVAMAKCCSILSFLSCGGLYGGNCTPYGGGLLKWGNVGLYCQGLGGLHAHGGGGTLYGEGMLLWQNIGQYSHSLSYGGTVRWGLYTPSWVTVAMAKCSCLLDRVYAVRDYTAGMLDMLRDYFVTAS